MLSKDKMILMTAVTAYENSGGKDDISINNFFRGDYLSFEILKSAIYGTIGFAVIFVMYILYDIEKFMVEFYKMDIVAFAKDAMTKYLIFLAAYVFITYVVSAVKYHNAKKNMAKYQEALKALYSYCAERE